MKHFYQPMGALLFLTWVCGLLSPAVSGLWISALERADGYICIKDIKVQVISNIYLISNVNLLNKLAFTISLKRMITGIKSVIVIPSYVSSRTVATTSSRFLLLSNLNKVGRFLYSQSGLNLPLSNHTLPTSE